MVIRYGTRIDPIACHVSRRSHVGLRAAGFLCACARRGDVWRGVVRATTFVTFFSYFSEGG